MIKIFCLLFFFILCIACSKEGVKTSTITEKSLDLQVKEAYLDGMEALEEGDIFFAAKKFNEVEILFPQSELAPKSSLMAAYAYYSQDYYIDCISELERFLRIYKFHKNLDYAYYLLALSYYEQIADEKKDTRSILKSKEYFDFLVNNFPNTEYAIDARFKIDLINDILAAKEMYVGRYYIERKKWIPAINRFKVVINNYNTTVYVEEALHRLVEIHYILGLKEESKKYANVLGYNYQSSKWYEESFIIFNKNYKKKKLNKDKKERKSKILNKFKSLIN
ncbi:outer membrane protein assembly factor BamD [Candidatus Pelagibacter communis]|uniref:outer membrane protein assembly factor BamD n=1 Tax=Pelagibacter ubique TaxID=198252 RepID=UPI00094DB503|nr:outer membrane protein assembly factor BamD [Candidatus Pelagibacter ubique]